MQTQATFRYASDFEGDEIPARSDNGTIAVNFATSTPSVTIYAPEAVNKGQVDLTIDQLRGLIQQAMRIEAIAEKNRKETA